MMDVAPILRDARFQVCRAFYESGPEAALAAVAAGSVRLAHHVVAGDLIWRHAHRALLQVAINLRLVNIFGRKTVQRALAAGPAFYEDIAEAA